MRVRVTSLGATSGWLIAARYLDARKVGVIGTVMAHKNEGHLRECAPRFRSLQRFHFIAAVGPHVAAVFVAHPPNVAAVARHVAVTYFFLIFRVH
jgi:hypothetical protein